MTMKYARNILFSVLLFSGTASLFPAHAAEGRHFVLEDRAAPLPQELGKKDTLELRGFTGGFLRHERGCYWVVDALKSLTLDPATQLVYTYTKERRPCRVLVEDVGSVINNGTITMQGIETYQMHGDPPAGRPLVIMEREASGRIEFRGVAYSGSGSFILPIEKKTFGSVEFSEGQINAPIRLALPSVEPLSTLPQSEIVRMQNMTFGKGMSPDNAVILATPEAGGMRLKLTHTTETLESAGKKHVFHIWHIGGVTKSGPAVK